MSTISTAQAKPLILEALKAREFAYVPYSKFRQVAQHGSSLVGAALLTEDGSIIRGCNVENASYGAGICAERTALTKAVSEGTKKFVAIAVSSDVPAPTTTPCGICRQFIREFCADSTPIYMVSSSFPSAEMCSDDDVLAAIENEKIVKQVTLGDLLPMSFGPENLQQTS
ncbi:hypothetical protein QFC20_005555 [Naganishia adeliensis]|uniref:Uncharacterized protein n=1 Tax=Naganishia adeliensis TaxID=92952 RepID=A0ACC2VN40_9TREE|nr:hypothetical protein QFC20_005555 [Naganishia adeliensis]